MNELPLALYAALTIWQRGGSDASDSFSFTWVLVIGLGVVVLLAFLIVGGYRKGWFEGLGYGPPNTSPKPNLDKPRAAGDSGSLEESITLLNYIRKQLDVVDNRTRVLEIDLRKVQGKLDMVETLARGLSTRLPRNAGELDFRQSPPFVEPQVELPQAESAGTVVPTTFRADTLAAARGAYQMLADDRVSASNYETLFADLDSAAQGAVVGEVNYSFKPAESKHSQFVIIPKDSSTGWLFPNPNRVFTEAMKVVFPHLSREQFEDRKISVDPMPVKVGSSGMWERAS